MNDSDLLRIGAVSYLNALPLTVDLRGDAGVALVEDVPSVVADGLDQGRVDVGLVPIAEVLRHPDWGRVPGLGIVSHGAVSTVLIVSRVPFEKIDRIGLDVSSRTSAVLARIILGARFGIDPETVPARPAVETPPEPAWLVIGDAAFHAAEGPGLRVLDAGEAWAALTGRPMVYAIWATRPGLDPRAVTERLAAARVAGVAGIESWVDAEAARRGIDGDRARTYLRRTIGYEVGPDELSGIDEFARRGMAAGWL